MDIKLNLDEWEQLVDLVQSETWPTVLKLFEFYVHLAEIDVVRYNIARGSDDLIYKHAKAKGARELLEKVIDRVTKREEGPKRISNKKPRR